MSTSTSTVSGISTPSIRVVFLGVGHWHTPLYVEPVSAHPHMAIVGGSDPGEVPCRSWSEATGTEASPDFQAVVRRTRPDLAIVLGQHDHMAEYAGYLIDEAIPFVIEKPGGVSLSEVRELDRRVASSGAFASVALPYRYGRFFRDCQKLASDGPLAHATLRYVSGPAWRYPKSGVDWVLQLAHAGGGTTVNLSIHLFDLLNSLLPSGRGWHVSDAVLSNRLSGAEVDDLSMCILKADTGALATVQSGYAYPWPSNGGDAARASGSSDTVHLDVAMSLCFENAYVRVPDPETYVIRMEDGHERTIHAPTSQVPLYRTLIDDTFERLRREDPPLVGFDDLLGAATMVDEVYERAGRGSGIDARSFAGDLCFTTDSLATRKVTDP